MSTAVSNAHTDAMANIAFGKKQQWTITNYVALIYAAILALQKGGAAATLEPWVLPTLVIVVGAYGAFLINRVQGSVARFRNRLTEINKVYFSVAELALLDLRAQRKPYFHDWPFIGGLWGAIAIGGFLVIVAMMAGPAT
jgi:hypothetical protein